MILRVASPLNLVLLLFMALGATARPKDVTNLQREDLKNIHILRDPNKAQSRSANKSVEEPDFDDYIYDTDRESKGLATLEAEERDRLEALKRKASEILKNAIGKSSLKSAEEPDFDDYIYDTDLVSERVSFPTLEAEGRDRLEALEKASGISRNAIGRFKIPSDFQIEDSVETIAKKALEAKMPALSLEDFIRAYLESERVSLATLEAEERDRLEALKRKASEILKNATGNSSLKSAEEPDFDDDIYDDLVSELLSLATLEDSEEKMPLFSIEDFIRAYLESKIVSLPTLEAEGREAVENASEILKNATGKSSLKSAEEPDFDDYIYDTDLESKRVSLATLEAEGRDRLEALKRKASEILKNAIGKSSLKSVESVDDYIYDTDLVSERVSFATLDAEGRRLKALEKASKIRKNERLTGLSDFRIEDSEETIAKKALEALGLEDFLGAFGERYIDPPNLVNEDENEDVNKDENEDMNKDVNEDVNEDVNSVVQISGKDTLVEAIKDVISTVHQYLFSSSSTLDLESSNGLKGSRPMDADYSTDLNDDSKLNEVMERAKEEAMERAKEEAMERAKEEAMERAKEEAMERAKEEAMERAKEGTGDDVESDSRDIIPNVIGKANIPSDEGIQSNANERSSDTKLPAIGNFLPPAAPRRPANEHVPEMPPIADDQPVSGKHPPQDRAESPSDRDLPPRSSVKGQQARWAALLNKNLAHSALASRLRRSLVPHTLGRTPPPHTPFKILATGIRLPKPGRGYKKCNLEAEVGVEDGKVFRLKVFSYSRPPHSPSRLNLFLFHPEPLFTAGLGVSAVVRSYDPPPHIFLEITAYVSTSLQLAHVTLLKCRSNFPADTMKVMKVLPKSKVLGCLVVCLFGISAVLFVSTDPGSLQTFSEAPLRENEGDFSSGNMADNNRPWLSHVQRKNAIKTRSEAVTGDANLLENAREATELNDANGFLEKLGLNTPKKPGTSRNPFRNQPSSSTASIKPRFKLSSKTEQVTNMAAIFSNAPPPGNNDEETHRKVLIKQNLAKKLRSLTNDKGLKKGEPRVSVAENNSGKELTSPTIVKAKGQRSDRDYNVGLGRELPTTSPFFRRKTKHRETFDRNNSAPRIMELTSDQVVTRNTLKRNPTTIPNDSDRSGGKGSERMSTHHVGKLDMSTVETRYGKQRETHVDTESNLDIKIKPDFQYNNEETQHFRIRCGTDRNCTTERGRHGTHAKEKAKQTHSDRNHYDTSTHSTEVSVRPSDIAVLDDVKGLRRGHEPTRARKHQDDHPPGFRLGEPQSNATEKGGKTTQNTNVTSQNGVDSNNSTVQPTRTVNSSRRHFRRLIARKGRRQCFRRRGRKRRRHNASKSKGRKGELRQAVFGTVNISLKESVSPKVPLDSCPENRTTNSPNLPLNVRSVCPWSYYVDHDPDRFPYDILQANCRCTACLDTTTGRQNYNYVCVPVTIQKLVSRRKKKKSGRGYRYRNEWVNVAVGCTCVEPRYSP
ncbi:Interleukin-17 [Branchiostoma belcheri]|nr:Interleukin-17 [Branchiostoma belcheri]